MRVEVMEHYGLTQSIEQAGYYETAHHKQLMKDIKGAIREGRFATLIDALFYDLAQHKQVQIPKQGERRERELQELVKKVSARWRCLLMRPMT